MYSVTPEGPHEHSYSSCRTPVLPLKNNKNIRHVSDTDTVTRLKCPCFIAGVTKLINGVTKLGILLSLETS